LRSWTGRCRAPPGPMIRRRGPWACHRDAPGTSSACGPPSVTNRGGGQSFCAAEQGGSRARVWGGIVRWELGSQRRGALYRAAQAILGRRAPDGRPAGNLGLTGAVVALRGRRNWRAGLAGQRKQRRGRGRVRAQAVSERGRRSRGLKRRGERLAGPGWERGALGLAGLGRGKGEGGTGRVLAGFDWAWAGGFLGRVRVRFGFG